MVLSTFSCVCQSFVYLFWRNAHSSHLKCFYTYKVLSSLWRKQQIITRSIIVTIIIMRFGFWSGFHPSQDFCLEPSPLGNNFKDRDWKSLDSLFRALLSFIYFLYMSKLGLELKNISLNTEDTLEELATVFSGPLASPFPDQGSVGIYGGYLCSGGLLITSSFKRPFCLSPPCPPCSLRMGSPSDLKGGE